jgi:hypothetical protein
MEGQHARKCENNALSAEARDPEREPQIDTAGWIYSAVAVAIIAGAVMVAYKANDAIVAVAPVPSQVVAR